MSQFSYFFSVIEDYFRIQKHIYKVIDVGGQRAERRRFLHVFDNMHAVLFVTSLSEYNMTLFEAVGEPRLDESLKLWKLVCSKETFKQSALVLFFNKLDLFKQKYYRNKVPLPTLSQEFTAKKPPQVKDEKVN